MCNRIPPTEVGGTFRSSLHKSASGYREIPPTAVGGSVQILSTNAASFVEDLTPEAYDFSFRKIKVAS